MKNILVIGATGQIGSELTMKLRGIYGNDHVVCGYIPSAAPKGDLAESGPAESQKPIVVYGIDGRQCSPNGARGVVIVNGKKQILLGK